MALERRGLCRAVEDTKNSGVVLREDSEGGGKEGGKSKGDYGKCKLHGELEEVEYDGLEGRACMFCLNWWDCCSGF